MLGRRSGLFLLAGAVIKLKDMRILGLDSVYRGGEHLPVVDEMSDSEEEPSSDDTVIVSYIVEKRVVIFFFPLFRERKKKSVLVIEAFRGVLSGAAQTETLITSPTNVQPLTYEQVKKFYLKFLVKKLVQGDEKKDRKATAKGKK